MRNTIIILLAIMTLTSCKKEKNSEKDLTKKSKDIVEEKQETNEWNELFDGKTFNGWHVYNGKEISSHWNIEDGVMAFAGRTGEKEYNIITDTQYTNFILSLEWKISEGGNSGIMWGVKEDEKYKYPYHSGPEIQVLDNLKHPDAKVANGTHTAGSLYDMIAPSKDVTKPVGEWNLCVIEINHKNNLGKVNLNGTEIVTFPVNGSDWDDMIANSKFKDWEGFGKYQTGHIVLQDHEDKVSYRNIKIKEL